MYYYPPRPPMYYGVPVPYGYPMPYPRPIPWGPPAYSPYAPVSFNGGNPYAGPQPMPVGPPPPASPALTSAPPLMQGMSSPSMNGSANSQPVPISEGSTNSQPVPISEGSASRQTVPTSEGSANRQTVPTSEGSANRQTVPTTEGSAEPIPAPKDPGKDLTPAPTTKEAPPVSSGHSLPVVVEGDGHHSMPVISDGPPLGSDHCDHGDHSLDDCNKKKWYEQRFELFADYLYWTVHGADVPFAQAFFGTDPFTSVPRGPVAVASPGWNSGFRVGGGVAICENSGVVATYTNFRDSTGASITAPDPFVLHANLVFPNTVNSAGDSLKASANYTIDLQMADIDYKCAFINTNCLQLSWLAGGRWAHLNEHLLALYDITGSTTVNEHILFNGGGPRAGLEGEYRVCKGLYGYGKGVANVLFGRFKTSDTEHNIFTGLVGDTEINSSRVVPILEMELGVAWQSPRGHLRVSAGYYVGAWFNTITPATLADSIEGQGFVGSGHGNFSSNMNNFRDNLTFDGFVGRIEVRY
jgi:hypothetical protein